MLKGEWGFAGLVTSDWDATRSTVPTAVGGLDLAMPGPNRFWGPALAEAVRAGQVPEEMVDDKLARLLGVARRVGALSEAGHARDAAGNGAGDSPPRRRPWSPPRCCAGP